MQPVKEESFKLPIRPALLLEELDFVRRYFKDAEALEPFLASLRARGVPETNLANVRMLLISLRETKNDRTAIYRVDFYTLAGIGALDLVLLTVVLPMGASGLALFLATLFLAISLVFVAMSLCISFAKQEMGLTSYGKVHSNILAVAEASGLAALTAAFWHSSTPVGILVLVLSVVAFLLFTFYYLLLKITAGFFRLQAAVTAPQPPEPPAPVVGPGGTDGGH
jgi:hypothetical protein